MTELDDDWTLVMRNLRKVRKIWISYGRSCDKKLQTCGCRGYFSRLWFRWFFSLGWIHGWWPPTWAGPWGFSRIGWTIVSQKDIHDGFGVEVGSTPPCRRRWRRKCGMWVRSWWRRTSSWGRIRSCSTTDSGTLCGIGSEARDLGL